MAPRRAIDLALDLSRMPALARHMRDQALPLDVLDVIRIAAGCPEASKAAVAATERSLSSIRAAAVFYLQEMLFFPEAGFYRNLGVSAGASRAQMRLHMRWLLQWLHPDHNSDETAALLAQRVITAWHELSRKGESIGSSAIVPSDRQASTRSNVSLARRHKPLRHRWIAVPVPPAARSRRKRAAIIILVVAAALVLIFIPDVTSFFERSLSIASDSSVNAVAASESGVTPVGHQR